MNVFGLIFLIALAATTALRLWLAARHIGHVAANRNAVPPAFAADIPLDVHQKAADYTAAKTRFGMITTVFDVLVLLGFTFGGGLQFLHDAAAGWFSPGIVQGLAFIALVALVSGVLDLPFSWWHTFRVEEAFGFNRTTPGVFWTDLVKHTLLGAILGLPLIAAVLWFMEASGRFWWLYAWGAWTAFNVLILAIYPTWIAPLFNKFSPMEDAELRQRVDALLARCGFRVKGLMVMDGSRRSSHGNAYFTGFGDSKRIVFFDTLLKRLEPAEVEAVLAHELGHFRLKHVVKRMVFMFALMFGFFWLLDLIMTQEWFYAGVNVTARSTAMALVLFLMVMPAFTFLLKPLGAVYSRKHEFEADQYAATNASAGDLASALVKLYKDNASTLTPDPVHSAVYDSHPPALARISRLRPA